MNILGTQYTLNNHAFEIYIAGCAGNPHCKGCHNPESWDFNQGSVDNQFFRVAIAEKIESFDSMIDNIMIFGGEPNDQNLDELEDFIRYLKVFKKPIWLFTRYSLEEVPAFEKTMCDYIKCGAYIPELTVEGNVQYGITLATSNQRIYKKGVDY